MRTLHYVTLLLAFVFHDSSVASVATESRPNILWINAEDMSPHLGCYGHPDAVTPVIDSLASKGLVYQNAFATAPICSPSRSCLATGLYATSLGTQHLRCDVAIPAQLKPLAVLLRELGYYCTNSGKSDYNFSPDGIWDAWNNQPAPWRDRKSGQPFFAFITVGETHEGRINFRDRYDQATVDLSPELRHRPEHVTIPPFYPDTPEIREIFAGMYDLATVFDQNVGEVIANLKEDGDFQNTIIFVFGDHGNGLPRYKRWLNDSGLRVPLVVYVPQRFQHLCSQPPGSRPERLVSFVDFPATAISLAGGDIPDTMQGQPFLGQTISEARKYVYGARSRADDMFEVSRSVSDGRYIYIRHFLPHYPYIQRSVIFDDRKSSFRELRKLHLAGKLNDHAERLWSDRKPVEELYDLQADPHELTNLANDARLAEAKLRLSSTLRQWMLSHRDSGLLPESEYQLRSQQHGATPFDIVQNQNTFDLDSTLDAAWLVGTKVVTPSDIVSGLRHPENGVRYWSAVTVQADESLLKDRTVQNALATSLDDESPSVRISTAEAILRHSDFDMHHDLKRAALRSLQRVLVDPHPWVSLEAASAMARLGPAVKPLVAVMKDTIDRNRSAPGSARPYKDFNYASFTGWALESALRQCGESEFVESIQ